MMNAMNTMPSVEAPPARCPHSNLHPALPSLPCSAPVRVAVFGSFYGGYHVLKELLTGPLHTDVQVTGVATDDPRQPYTHPHVRLWRYPHTEAEEEQVKWLALAHDLPLYTGRIKTEQFHQMFVAEWRPDLCLMATFGQIIPRRIFTVPRLGFYNFHHSDLTWPSYPGPDPIAGMLRDGKPFVVLNLHEVNEVLDGGRFVAHSHRVPLPKDTNAAALHRVSWPQMGPFIRQQVQRMIETAVRTVH
jgi:methionyl-tRNA formyltransferase